MGLKTWTLHGKDLTAICFVFLFALHGDWHLHFGNWVNSFSFLVLVSRFGFSVFVSVVFFTALRFSSASFRGYGRGFFFRLILAICCVICFDFWGFCM